MGGSSSFLRAVAVRLESKYRGCLEYMRNATSQSHSKYDTSKLRSQSVVRPSTERKRPCCRGHCYPQEKLYPSSVCFLG